MNSKLRQALHSTFPNMDPDILWESLQLRDIPGWDSMNAINLLGELEALLQRGELDLPLRGDMTVRELEEEMYKRGYILR